MDRLEAMAIFVSVAEAGSLAAAARRLGRSPSLITRAVAQLEADAGQRLLDRTTRRFSITEEGHRHLAAYRSVLDELAHLGAHSHDVDIAGNVVVTAPELFGRLRVLPVVESFLKAYPQTEVRLLLLNRMVDMIGEGVDVAIRLAELPDSSMTAVKIGEVRHLTCAAPAYLAEHPAPKHPSDLLNHRCIGLNEAGTQELWRYRASAPSNRVRSMRVKCHLALNSAGAAIDAARHGLGLVRPLSYQVEEALSEGSLVTVLEDYEPDPVPVHLLFQQRRVLSNAVRAFIDYAVPLLRHPPKPTT